MPQLTISIVLLMCVCSSYYGDASIGDLNNYWVVAVVSDLHRGKREKVDWIYSLTTRTRLHFRHSILGCYILAVKKNLPKWGSSRLR